MSTSGLNFKGRPNTDQVETMRILLYCGGGGGGACVEPIGFSGIVIPYRVQKYITYNRKLIFHNLEFLGVQIFNDAGPAGFCSHSIGTEQPFWMGLAADPDLDIEDTAKAGYQLGGAPPYDIEFPAEKCPQPDDPAWENIVYVYLWWGDPGYINGGTGFTPAQISIVKHDKDSRQ